METLNALKIRLNTFPFDKRFSQATLNGSIVMLLLAQTATGLYALQCITLSTSSILLLTPMSPRTSWGDSWGDMANGCSSMNLGAAGDFFC